MLMLAVGSNLLTCLLTWLTTYLLRSPQRSPMPFPQKLFQLLKLVKLTRRQTDAGQFTSP